VTKMTRFLGTIISLIVVFGAVHMWPARANADDAQNMSTYRQYVSALNRGDVDGALSLFTDDAQLSGLRPFCVPNPCVGRAAIQTQLNYGVSNHIQLQLLSSVNVVNGNVTVGVAHRNDLIRAAGLSRVVVAETLTFRGDKIAKYVVEAETSDPQTAAFLRSLSPPTQAPALPVSAPAPAIQPPSTGDGGFRPGAQRSR
jgi:hypothetical protein